MSPAQMARVGSVVVVSEGLGRTHVRVPGVVTVGTELEEAPTGTCFLSHAPFRRFGGGNCSDAQGGSGASGAGKGSDGGGTASECRKVRMRSPP